ncbi:MAG TPA: hypothetical protein VGY97_08475 [Solirubrobacteraceae bacterium]|jgi:hypothetical protein|nr:hypothetical protein [Solirubrobacteraceae bacterium]
MFSSVARALAALAVTAVCLTLTATALATPVTINLRIEGATKTLFEGPLTTDAHTAANPINAPDSSTSIVGPHPCDYKDNGNPPLGGSAAGTPTTAAFDGVAQAGATFGAIWYSSQGDFFVTQLGSDANGGPPTYPSWGFAVNYQSGSVGGCQLTLSSGDQVLWAYDFFNKVHLLKLAGPSVANVGQPITVKVTDGGTAAAMPGASVGGQTTDAQGNASITFSKTGTQSLKAEAPSSVRSNRLDVCVHNGNDGTCGSTAPTSASSTTPAGTLPTAGPAPAPPTYATGLPVTAPATGFLRGIRYGHRFARDRAPRTLRGTVSADATGIEAVRLRLSRRTIYACQGFDARLERFRSTRCGIEHAPWFSVGTSTRFSYLLPHRLRPGRYVLDLEVIDGAGHRDDQPVPGRNRIVFSVLY